MVFLGSLPKNGDQNCSNHYLLICMSNYYHIHSLLFSIFNPHFFPPRSRNMSWTRTTSLPLVTLVLESRNTLIWASSMTLALVSMVWISMWSWVAQASMWVTGRGSVEGWVPLTAWPRKMPWNGSSRRYSNLQVLIVQHTRPSCSRCNLIFMKTSLPFYFWIWDRSTKMPTLQCLELDELSFFVIL